MPDLQTAIAHKMGCPMVVLTLFPLDTTVVARVPKGVAARLRILPLMIDQRRLIVAVAKPSRKVELRSLHLAVQTPIVAVLAPRMQIGAAPDRLPDDPGAAPRRRRFVDLQTDGLIRGGAYVANADRLAAGTIARSCVGLATRQSRFSTRKHPRRGGAAARSTLWSANGLVEQFQSSAVRAGAP